MGSAADLLAVARSQLGQSENPPYSNRVKFSDWYGLVGPWCDMFVSWCGAMSGNGDAIGKFAYTPSHEAWFRSRGREVPVRDAQPGDIVFFNFIGRTSHVGIVEANRGDGLVTIEGNTNGGGSRDGGSVMRHFRSWSSGIVSTHRPAFSGQPTGEAMADLIDQIRTELVNADERAKAREARMVADILAHVDEQTAALRRLIGQTKRGVKLIGTHTGLSDKELAEAFDAPDDKGK